MADKIKIKKRPWAKFPWHVSFEGCTNLAEECSSFETAIGVAIKHVEINYRGHCNRP